MLTKQLTNVVDWVETKLTTDSNSYSQRIFIPLLFIDHNGGELDHLTRLQKLSFLVVEKSDRIPDSTYRFKRRDYGPVSPRLSTDIDALVEHGLIDRTIDVSFGGSERHSYELTERGEQLLQADDEFSALEQLREDTAHIHDQYGDMNIHRLIHQVYNEYPEYEPRVYKH